MLTKQVRPATAAVALLIMLALVQIIYWRQLVYRPMGQPGGGGGGGPLPPPIETALGRTDVQVELHAGEHPGYEDGPVWKARFSGPNALALAPDGALLVADSRNHRIRRISPEGSVSTLAGGGEPGGPGGMQDGPASQARFRLPSGVAAGPDGAVYISDTGNHRLCRLQGGVVTTLAGSVEGRADASGTAARFRYPAALAFHDGALWVADLGNAAVRRVTTDGVVSTPPQVPSGVREALGDLEKPAAPVRIAASPEGEGNPVEVRFTLGRRSASAAANDGLRLFGDTENHVLMAQRGGEPPLLLAGLRSEVGTSPGSRDGTGNRASFALPCAAVMADGGTAYVAEYDGNCIRRVRLPGWLVGGDTAPVRQDARTRRRQRGR